LASVVVTDFIGGTVVAGVASLLAHPVHADPVGPALVAAATDGLADTLIADLIWKAVVW
jgi:hypothetical protein